MSTRAPTYDAQVISREQVSRHLVRLRLGGPGLASFTSTGVPDEWVGLVVPGQFQSRYYTVRACEQGARGPELEVDVVIHDVGLVTGWVAGECVGEPITVIDARGSFDPPPDADWLMLVGDLTALPAMARVCAETSLPTRVWAEVPVEDGLAGYLPDSADVTWLEAPADGTSRLAAVVEGLDWPAGAGYFWMAGESAQMRAIRKHLMRVRRLPSTAYDVMGYWRAGATRQPRSVDPGPIYRAGKSAGKSDEEIWADFDAAQQEANDG